MTGLLGLRPTRQFKIYRSEFPAIFRFNGKLYQEFHDIDIDEDYWMEIEEVDAERLLKIADKEE